MPTANPYSSFGFAIRFPSIKSIAFALFIFLGWIPIPASGEEPEPEERKRRLLSTLLNNELPFTNPESSFQLRYSAKASDVVKESYIRIPLELRYGISEYTEAYLSYQPYINNPFDKHAVSSSGLAGLGIKHRLTNFIDERWDLAFGLRTFVPLSEIPSEDEREQFGRYEPYVVMTYLLPRNERLRATLHARYDWVKGEPFFENGIDPQPSSTFYLRPGIIFTPPGEWRYTFELEYQTERFSGSNDDGWLVAASLGWFPKSKTLLSRLPGVFDFTIRLGYALSQLPIDQAGSPEEIDLRVRWSKRNRR